MLINKDTFLKIIAYHIQGLIKSTCVETRVLSVILQFYLVFLRQDLLLFIAMQTKLADLSSCTRINEITGVLPLLGLGDPNSVSHACISSRAIALVPGIWVFIYYLQKHFCFYFIFPSFYFFICISSLRITYNVHSSHVSPMPNSSQTPSLAYHPICVLFFSLTPSSRVDATHILLDV